MEIPMRKFILMFFSIIMIGRLQAQSMAIIGGEDDAGFPYAVLVSPTGMTTALTGSALPTGAGAIYSVAINSSGNAIIGGGDNGYTSTYVALVSPTGVTTALTGTALPTGNGIIFSVAINSSGNAIIGGQDNGDTSAYAALVSPTGVTTALTGTALPTGSGGISWVAINSSGNGIIGGFENGAISPNTTPYAALVSPTGATTALTGPVPPVGTGKIYFVAINSSGNGIIGGQDNGNTSTYVALVSPTGVRTALTGSALPTAGGLIWHGDINPSGYGIIGGYSQGLVPYAALVSPTGETTALTGPALPTGTGQIISVAINPSGYGIIGGESQGTVPYAALVSPTGETTALTGPALPTGTGQINAVAIAPSGNGIIGGTNINADTVYVALVSSTGMTTALTGPATPTGTGEDLFVAIANLLPLLSNIPTASLSGNNLIFAEYINEYASQEAFYFVPAVLDGTLNAALESAAPTRNAFSVYTAINNLFYLTTSLSTHIRQQRSVYSSLGAVNPSVGAVNPSVPQAPWKSEDQLLAFLGNNTLKKTKSSEVCHEQEPKNTIWVDLIGGLAYQKAQSQTPAFNPSTGGGILAFDRKVTSNATVGGGAPIYIRISMKRKGRVIAT
jgi:hypothetical protein